MTFCHETGLPPLPLSEHTLCLFVAHLAQQNLQHSSIRTYLSSLRHLQISAGLPNPFTQDAFPRLTYVLRGLKRTSPSQPDKRLPITPEILEILRRHWSIPLITYEHRLLWAACCLGFFGFLRVAEFTARSTTETPPNIVAINDIQRAAGYPPEFIRVHLRQSKTDPFGTGVHVYLGRTNHSICPVAAILSFVAIRPPNLPGPLLRFLDGSTLSRTYLVTQVKKALSAAGIDPSRYSAHSFRIGAATTAAAAGIPDHQIKMLGRWESSAYTLYVRTPPNQLSALSARLVRPQQNQNTSQPLAPPRNNNLVYNTYPYGIYLTCFI